MRSHLQLTHGNRDALPEQFKGDDVRYADELVRHFLGEFTQPGQIVFDPFAGFGTTLIVAEEMGRQALGLEFDEERCKYTKSKLKNPDNLICGDATKLTRYGFPPIDFSMTSPPYMNKYDHPQNPLTAYSTTGTGYGDYLQGLQDIYRQVNALMTPNAKAIVEVANLKTDGKVTPLAWDIGQALGMVMQFEGEIVLCWDRHWFGYEHSYCLLFSRMQQD